MAKVDILYHCGCGFKSHNQGEAETHCDDMRHDLSVDGIIHSTTRTNPKQAVMPSQKSQKPVAAPQQPPAVASMTSDLDRLRSLIMKSKT